MSEGIPSYEAGQESESYEASFSTGTIEEPYKRSERAKPTKPKGLEKKLKVLPLDVEFDPAEVTKTGL